MTNTDQERWRRVKERLRSELGDDVFSSWFGRMELEAADNGLLRLSVPTRFLRNWIQSHYSERVLARWQEEEPEVTRLELSVRSATIKLPPVKPKIADPASPVREQRDGTAINGDMRASVPLMSVHEALGGSPLDPRLTFEIFHRRPLKYAGSCRGKAGRDKPARRSADVQPALHPCRRRSRQNPPAASDHLGRQQRRRPQNAVPDGRTIHVRLRLGACARRRRSPSRKRCAPSTCW